ncbi:MAG: hypothetical protein M1819_003809 [Sarea resinae]|nr:MAG: hypothetical protein M1819_003809 [Sarea resinae]
MGVPSISIRRHIRWVPDKASEPTSTLVLTSSTSHFVDVRIFKPTSDEEPELPNQGGPLERLQWAFAGRSHTDKATKGDGDGDDAPPHAIWEHWVDSNSDSPAADEGDLWTQPNGETLEKGRMVNPDTGRLTDYEELWADAAIQRTGLDPKRGCVVLRLEDRKNRARGMVIRVGGWCQGIYKLGNEVNVERWQWVSTKEVSEDGDESGDWERVMKIGSRFLPCAVTFRLDRVHQGNTVHAGDAKWEVIEKFEW